MHEISDETFQKAQDHALLAEQHGKQTQDIAQRLEEASCITAEQKERLEKDGELMQQSAQGVFNAVDAAHQHPESATEAYGLAVEHHIQANQHHLDAIQVLLDVQQNEQSQPFEEN